VNLSHAFHAGNFADVVKHAVLALALERLPGEAGAVRLRRHPQPAPDATT
jgi:23S rRNA A2030 N6-methylase RlmJ